MSESELLVDCVKDAMKERDELADALEQAQVRREELAEGREHLTVTSEFQSDKYPWCPAGFVPLKVTDPMATTLLWAYAGRRRVVDKEFSRDLEEALLFAGDTCPPHDLVSRGDGTSKCSDCGELADVTETGAARSGVGDSQLKRRRSKTGSHSDCTGVSCTRTKLTDVLSSIETIFSTFVWPPDILHTFHHYHRRRRCLLHPLSPFHHPVWMQRLLQRRPPPRFRE